MRNSWGARTLLAAGLGILAGVAMRLTGWDREEAATIAFLVSWVWMMHGEGDDNG